MHDAGTVRPSCRHRRRHRRRHHHRRRWRQTHVGALDIIASTRARIHGFEWGPAIRACVYACAPANEDSSFLLGQVERSRCFNSERGIPFAECRFVSFGPAWDALEFHRERSRRPVCIRRYSVSAVMSLDRSTRDSEIVRVIGSHCEEERVFHL